MKKAIETTTTAITLPLLKDFIYIFLILVGGVLAFSDLKHDVTNIKETQGEMKEDLRQVKETDRKQTNSLLIISTKLGIPIETTSLPVEENKGEITDESRVQTTPQYPVYQTFYADSTTAAPTPRPEPTPTPAPILTIIPKLNLLNAGIIQ